MKTCAVRASAAIFAILAFLFLSNDALLAQEAEQPGFKVWTGDLDGMKKRRLIRILVPYSKTIFFLDRGRQYGTAVELGHALGKWLNEGNKKETERIRIAFVVKPRDELLPALDQGLGDIVAANLTVTPERQGIVDFTLPLLIGVKEVLVTGPAAPAVKSMRDLVGQEIRVRTSSSYRENLQATNVALKAAGAGEIVIKPIDEHLEDEDLLEMVNAGLLPWCVVDNHKAEIWARVFPQIRIHPDIAFSGEGAIAWAVRKNTPLLKEALDEFVKNHKAGTTFGNILRKRYFKDDQMLRRAYDPPQAAKFRQLVDLFRKHGATYTLDYILLAAQGYQESQLDQSRRSPRGAVGVMQLMPATAADKSVAIAEISTSEDRNIEAGSKYLRHIIDTYLDEPALDQQNQFLLALAAYNAGPGNLRKFRKKAVELELNPNLWFDNVENGAAEIVGRETVQYVSNIYMYYVAYTLLLETMVGNNAAKMKTGSGSSQ